MPQTWAPRVKAEQAGSGGEPCSSSTLIPKEQRGQVCLILLSSFTNWGVENLLHAMRPAKRKGQQVFQYGQGPELHWDCCPFSHPAAGRLLEPQSHPPHYPRHKSRATTILFSPELYQLLQFLSSSASVFAAVISLVLPQTKPVFTPSSTCSKLFCCPVNSPQACSARLRPAHTPAPELGCGLLPPSPCLGAAGEACPAAPLTQGAWAQTSSAQHKLLMRSAVNLTPEGCSHRHPAVINSQQPRGQSLR